MQWPHFQDYNQAIQDPAVSVSEPELCQGRALTNAPGRAKELLGTIKPQRD
jgi:hypothetical protein